MKPRLLPPVLDKLHRVYCKSIQKKHTNKNLINTSWARWSNLKEVAATEEPPKLDAVINPTVLFSTSAKQLQLFYKPRRRPSKRSKAIALAMESCQNTGTTWLAQKAKKKKKEQPQNQLKLARANLECMNILVQILHITEGDSGFCGPRSGS